MIEKSPALICAVEVF